MDISLFIQQSVKFDTGFHACTLQYIWDRYNAFGGSPPGTFGGLLEPMVRSTWRRQAYFYAYFIWLHQGLSPKRSQGWKLKNFPQFSMCPTTFKENVLPLGDALASLIEEIDYSRRCEALLTTHRPPARMHTPIHPPTYPRIRLRTHAPIYLAGTTRTTTRHSSNTS